MKKSLTSCITCVALSTVLFAFGQFQNAQAAITWTGDLDPTDPTAWDSSTAGTIGSTTNGSLTVSNSSVLLSDRLFVGFDGTGTLNLTNGGAVNASGVLLVDLNNTGSKVVFDNGSITAQAVFAAEADLEGTGTIDTQGWSYDFDRVFSQASDLKHQFVLDSLPGQNVTVDVDLSTGAGRIGAGYDGNVTLTFNSGVDVVSNRGYIGYQADAVGIFNIDGPGTTWTDNGNSFTVGYRGTGTLNITDGGVVSNGGIGRIGSRPGSTGLVTVDGTGSTWTNSSGILNVGALGSGVLNITGGGVVSGEGAGIGSFLGSTGLATVNGVGSTWTNDGVLHVSFEGSGTLNITDGGAVSNNQFSTIGFVSGSTGEVTVDGSGSTWTNNDTLDVGRDGSGTLNITGGGLVSVGETLIIDNNGGDDSFINMSTGGMLALFGDAEDSLVDFMGLIGGTDAIRYWDDAISDWADITGAVFGDDYTLDFLTAGDLTGYTILTVGVLSGPTGDFDSDGDVDGADFLSWQRGETSPSLDPEALATWQDNYGITGTLADSTTTVPEPTTALLLSISAALLVAKRRS